jgi:hypothetical protein
MTDVHESRSDRIGAGAPEVTTEMIDAGIEAYRVHDKEFDPAEEIVRSIFLAMWATKPK